MALRATHQCHGGVLHVFSHDSAILDCTMQFSLFLPPQARDHDVPLLTYLSGLTCTHDNFTTKAAAYGHAAHAGIAVLAPDTSPRGDHVPDDEGYDFGQGAGFYINATQAPWAKNFQMESYITQELNALVCKHHPVLPSHQGITGHSMGGHGALTLGLKYPTLFRSISAFAPIVAPASVPWGEKAFTGYLGANQADWLPHDACALMRQATNRHNTPPILIDQGADDSFLEEQLKPHLFEEACAQAGQALILRQQEGYDHSYYFVQSFMADHMAHHAAILMA